MANRKKMFLKEHKWVLQEWDYEQNQHLDLGTILEKSGKRAWWICQNNKKHKWEATIASRTKGIGCPYCAGKKVLYEESFGYLSSDLLKEWDSSKNEMSPFKIRIFSNKKVWWICEKGHEWEAKVNQRSNGRGCPYCARQIVTKESSLFTTHPELSREWHPSKNNGILPETVFYGTQKKYWWVCKEGHEWDASPNNRSRGRNCPYCNNKKATTINNLEVLRPELIQEWIFDMNIGINPKTLTLGSDQKIWWKCSICDHKWESRINKRAKGQGCPKCNRQFGTSFSEQALYFYIKQMFTDAENRYSISCGDSTYELDIYIPSLYLAIEYDGEQHSTPEQVKRDESKNMMMQKIDVKLIRVRLETLPNIESYGSYVMQRQIKESFNNLIKKLFIKIKTLYSNSNIFIPDIYVERDSIKIMEEYIIRKKANSITETHPHLEREWNFNKNGKINPNSFTAGSNIKVWWKCIKGHEWESTINHRSFGTNCPYCNNHRLVEEKCLAIVNPSLSNEWHRIKNGDLTPYTIAANSNKKVWWKCSSKGHEWEATVNNRNSLNRGCPYCSGRRATESNCLQKINPDLAIQWHPTKNGNLTPEDVKPNSGLKVYWKCEQGHEWKAIIQSRNKGTNCPYCRNIRK